MLHEPDPHTSSRQFGGVSSNAMIFISLCCFLVVGFLIFNPQRDDRKTNQHERQDPDHDLAYTVVDEVLSDVPFRTMIKQYIVVSGIPTAAELEAKLKETYRAILADAKGAGYYHEVPDVFIYIYGTKEQAEAGNLWIGMLAKTAVEKTIDLRISESRLAALSRAPEERFGLSEQRRKEIFRALTSALDKAECIALERFPNWHSQGPNHPKRMITEQELHEQIDLQRKLEQEYRAEVAQLYELTMEKLEELEPKISLEAAEEGWPPPAYPCE